jgi:hypothetical protein
MSIGVVSRLRWLDEKKKSAANVHMRRNLVGEIRKVEKTKNKFWHDRNWLE